MEEKNQIHMGRIKIDQTLAELCAGLILWGILCQIIGFFPAKDKSSYSIGLWYGVFTGILAGIHMWWSLDRALDFSSDAAVKAMTKSNILRYLFLVVMMGLVMISGFASPLSAFLGLIGLKVSAYIQPFTHKLFSKLRKEDLENEIRR